MSEFLLVGGEVDGEIRKWPRPDKSACRFTIPGRELAIGGISVPYYPHVISLFGENFRVAHRNSYLYKDTMDQIRRQLIQLSDDDEDRVRINPNENSIWIADPLAKEKST